ncbi:MAG: cation-translocating P-type ATPase [Alphaproteobacteria bacterium]
MRASNHDSHTTPDADRLESSDKHQHGSDCCAGQGIGDPGKRTADGGRGFVVSGLDCAEEVAILKNAIGPLVDSPDRLSFDVLNGRMFVSAEKAEVSDDDICAAIAKTGMQAQPWTRQAREEPGLDRHRRLQVWLTSLSGMATLAGLLVHLWLSGSPSSALELLAGHAGQATPLPEVLAYLAAIAFGGRYVVVKAWHAARNLRPDINLLMVIAVTGAVAIGEWFEAATVTFLFALSLTLESWSVGRARRAIAALLDLTPPTIRLYSATKPDQEMAAADAPVGTLFVVRPGERIALDGEIVSGATAVNQAPITGESMPVPKDAGDDVFAGTINGEGVIVVESRKRADDTTLARIIRMVEQAHSRRARAEQWVEKFAKIYTPAVIIVAIAVFLVPPLLFGGFWEDWFYQALVLLVIACPCALVISTPVSIVSGLASAARNGLLIKGGSYLEQPARLKAIAFDKTGTLTLGEPKVVQVVPLNGHDERELLQRAAALEQASTHPLARAILDHAAALAVPPIEADHVRALPGKGVEGRIGETAFWLGSHRYFLERGLTENEASVQAEKLEQCGRTVVLIGNDQHVCGLIAVADAVRPEAKTALSALRGAAISHLVMLTGDNEATAKAIAKEVGIDEVRAELLPDDKVAAVEELVATHGTVAMVGDGINDAPAMARASLGIAMGTIGSDAAIETADIALMSDDLQRLPWLIEHSRRTVGIIEQNIIFSLGIKVLFVVLTFAGFATLWGAIAADVGASLLVVANALRLLGGASPLPNPAPLMSKEAQATT